MKLSLIRWYQRRYADDYPRPYRGARWKRLPIIRHARALWIGWRIARWYSSGPGSFGIPTGYDHWIVRGIWEGHV